jgi:hypothetical protein
MHRSIKDVININSIRSDKQEKIDQSVKALCSDLFSFVERNANIREKVRAKHIFCEKSNLNLHDLENKHNEALFFFWFCFDYVNIQGMTMYQYFLQKFSNELQESTLRVAPFLLALTIEPVVVQSKSEDDFSIIGNNIFTKQVEQMKGIDKPFVEVNKGDLLLGWTVKLGYEKRLIGPFISINSEKTNLYNGIIIHMFEREKMKRTLPSWRTFMKTNGYMFLFPAKLQKQSVKNIADSKNEQS